MPSIKNLKTKKATKDDAKTGNVKTTPVEPPVDLPTGARSHPA